MRGDDDVVERIAHNDVEVFFGLACKGDASITMEGGDPWSRFQPEFGDRGLRDEGVDLGDRQAGIWAGGGPGAWQRLGAAADEDDAEGRVAARVNAREDVMQLDVG